MNTLFQLKDFVSGPSPISLTIGNFDGVHLGHQAILAKLRGQKVVFTFSNHPLEILQNLFVPRLSTTEHRLALLSQHGIDTTIFTPFTEAFSKQSPEEFLYNLRRYLPFSHLVLGHDAVIGYERGGDASTLKALAKKIGFTLDYLPPVTYEHTVVSSSAIRSLIQVGDFTKASALLGRPYSIFATVEPGTQQGRFLGFQTANLKVHTLCLPPLGVYSITTQIQGKSYLGVANLGYAPTLHAERPPLLEVHLIDFKGDLYSQPLDVEFIRYLRPERRFDSIEALKAQIATDIASALAHSEKAPD